MWNPEDYAKHSDAQLKWARELRSRLDLSGNESVLDVGCGDGKITADFALTLPQGRVVGVDNSHEMIAYATRTYSPLQYPNLAFDCMDAGSLNFDEGFDLVFSNAVLHWVENHQAFLSGASRALRSGGRLVISCGGKGNAEKVLKIFSELVAEPSWSSYFTHFQNPYFFYGVQDYQLWLQNTGFRVHRLELVPKDMVHRGRDGLAAWIRTTWMPITKCVPEHERDKFILDFIDAYLEQMPLDSNGFAHVGMVRLEVDAFKETNPPR